MVKQIGFAALVGAVLIWPAAGAQAQLGFGIHIGDDHHDDHHDGHHGGRHDDHHGGHHDGHGIGIHLGGGHLHDYGFHDGHLHDSDWHFVVPHYDHHHHGTYFVDEGINYYLPQPYLTNPGTHVAARPIAIEFGGYAHIDDLSARLERLANQLCLDLHYNYRHNADFDHVYREAYQVLAAAKYIHAKEHQGDRAEVARRLDEVDGLFHHVQEQVAGWSRRNHRQIGRSGVQTKLNIVEATLHHLMNDVGVKGAHGVPTASASEEAAPVPAAVPLPPPGQAN
jgi:hypothetical protein